MLGKLLAVLLFILTNVVFAQTLPAQAGVADVPGAIVGRFITADEHRQGNPNLFGEFSRQGAARDAVSSVAIAGWSTSISTSIRLSAWNNIYYGPRLANTGLPVNGVMSNLNWTVDVSYCSLYWQYPIEVFVLAYDVAGNYLGYAQVGYVQAPSTTRSLNIAAYNLPMNTKFQYAFRVNGGGSNSVEYPPTISRVAASVN